jgi:bifunctional DNA-binding transcriptional regulator/antitoxin component of YhaV-PrlF toxin-antitoxin module
MAYSIMEPAQEPIFDHSSAAGAVRVRLGENGRLVVPSAMRQVLGARAGDWVILELVEGESGQEELRLTTAKRRLRRAIERTREFVPPGTNAVDELMRERRQQALAETAEATCTR